MKSTAAAIAIKAVVLLAMLGAAENVIAADAAAPYPKMAPLDEYLMHSDAEIELARSAAPDAISKDATVMILTRDGYKTAVKGTNGWVCLVDRSWSGMLDHPEFWNPKVRAPGCLNPAVARTFLPYDYKRTNLILAGKSKEGVIAATKTAIAAKQLPAIKDGVCYMMSKSAYLGDFRGHNMPHVMFYAAGEDAAAWGANLPNSPIMGVSYWAGSTDSYPQLEAFPPIYVYLVPVDKWSDGSDGPSMNSAREHTEK
jgi:hypothetical protein